MMAIWDDSNESSDESSDDEEQANMALMGDVDFESRSECVDEEIKVLSDLTRSELIIVVNDFLNKNHFKIESSQKSK